MLQLHVFHAASVTTTLTSSLLVTHFVYFVSFTFVHPSGTVIFSLPVNVNVNVPLVHAACVILHVGGISSIHLADRVWPSISGNLTSYTTSHDAVYHHDNV